MAFCNLDPDLIPSMTRTPRIQAGYQKHPTANVHWIISVSTPLDFHIYMCVCKYIYIYIWARLVISCPWLSMWLGTTTTINYLLIHAVHEANVHALNSVSYYVEICKAGKSRMTMKATALFYDHGTKVPKLLIVTEWRLRGMNSDYAKINVHPKKLTLTPCPVNRQASQ